MIERVHDRVAGLPYMTLAQATRLSEFISSNGIRECLELGFYHGVSSAYIAEILSSAGGGHLTTIDLLSARDRQPNIEDILSDLNLRHQVTVYYEQRSYTWRLMRLIEQHNRPPFDFCYVDGGHTWDVSGFAFFLVEKLLRSGGWILFDDLDWTYEKDLARRTKTGAAIPSYSSTLPDEEIKTAQVRKVWELLVKRHPGFGDFHEEGQWGFAQKRR